MICFDKMSPRPVPPKPQAPVATRRGRPLLSAATLLAFLLGFTLVSSVAGSFNPHPGWMLGIGMALCLAIPLLVALWLYRLAGEQRAPSARTLILSTNLLLVALLGGLSSDTTRQALQQRGSWWLTAMLEGAGADANGPSIRAARKAARRLARALPTPRGQAGPSRPKALAQAPAVQAPLSNDHALVLDAGVDPPPLGEPTDEPPSPEQWPEAPSEGDGIRIHFERKGSAIIVPVTLWGPQLSTRGRMLFDTGASYSTIDTATLSRLGLYVSSTDPTLTLQTANGRVQRTVTVIDAVAVGDAYVNGGLTVALCDACTAGGVLGLLGLNFSRHFRVTVDHEAGELVLLPKANPTSKLYDIRPFAALTNVEGTQAGDRFRVTLTVHNQSPRMLRDVGLVAITKGTYSDRITATVDGVPPHGDLDVALTGQISGPVQSFSVNLERAEW